MDNDETRPTGLMIPRFQYGDTPDINAHHNEDSNSKVDNSQRSIDLSGIMSNESDYSKYSDKAKPQSRLT